MSHYKKLFYPFAMTLVVGCGKSDDSSTSSSSQPATVADAYSSLAASVTKLNVAGYTGTTLNLADESWTSNDWGTTARFNCFGSCSGSISAKTYVADALNKSKSGPMGTVHGQVQIMCVVGNVLSSAELEGGIPKIGTHKITYTDTIGTNLKNNCNATTDELAQFKAGTLSIVSAESGSTIYDRLLTFNMTSNGSTTTSTFYYKNSGGKVMIGEYAISGTATASGKITHSIFSQDISTGEFRMEYFYRTFPVPTSGGAGESSGGSYSFYRGYYNSNTKEVRFFSGMGNSRYAVNHTFLGLSANDDQKTAGAYIARTAEDTTKLEGAFVCFTKADGSFVNNTGCVENSAETRKISWNSSSTLWSTVTGKGFADWGSTPVDIVAFDKTTMFTLEPNYK